MTPCEEAIVLQREIARLLRDQQRLMQALCIGFAVNVDLLGLEVKF